MISKIIESYLKLECEKPKDTILKVIDKKKQTILQFIAVTKHNYQTLIKIHERVLKNGGKKKTNLGSESFRRGPNIPAPAPASVFEPSVYNFKCVMLCCIKWFHS